ncbi:MAG: glutamate 5-kinase [Lentisphaeraceae bacterium]|nr:glutamate 5-kinase [Lentisphaeraceae bacterium]
MLKRGILPIINENDSVSVAEICFGENDYLAALVGIISKAELTVLLTSVNGMFAKNEDGTFGERFSVINEVTPELRQMASGTDGNELSTGGMATKLKAAEAINQVGENLWILDGTEFDVLSKLMDAEDLGTLFPGSDEKMRAHKRWMAFFPEIAGTLVIDRGAQKALVKQGSSLLPGGILFVEGNFIKGDIIEIRSSENVLLAKGAVNYSSVELKNLKGRKTAEISGILGYHSYDEAIHRDNLVLLNSEEK